MSGLTYVVFDSMKKSKPSDKYSVLLLVLCSPLLILIDHGHFQYNAVMSGLALWAVIFAMKG